MPIVMCGCVSLFHVSFSLTQEIRATGGPGYKYISVEEDEAGNVIFCNGTLLHLAAEQIPKGFAVSPILRENFF